MRMWYHVSHSHPCSVCGKPDWCVVSSDGVWAICRRIDTGVGIHKTDKSGADYWLYRLDDYTSYRRSLIDLQSIPQAERADPASLDRVYRALLAALPLSSTHRQTLRHRGLPDAEVLRRRYRTLPLTGRAALAKRLIEQLGADLCSQVPGFYIAERHGRRWWSLAGAAGLLIPVHNIDGHIVALKVRADNLGDGPKYTSVSSARHGGPTPGAQVHVPLHARPQGDPIRLTEGELKADVATTLSGVLTISVPGVGLWRKALPVLQALGAQHVLLAFDADWRTNPQVGQALGHSAMALARSDIQVQVEDWDPSQGKGIDDVLAGGHTPRQTFAAVAFGAAVRRYVAPVGGALSTIALKEVPAWRQ